MQVASVKQNKQQQNQNPTTTKKGSRATTFLSWLLRDYACKLPNSAGLCQWRKSREAQEKQMHYQVFHLSAPTTSRWDVLSGVDVYPGADLFCSGSLLVWTMPNSKHSHNTDGCVSLRNFKTDMLIRCTVCTGHWGADQLLLSILPEGNLHVCRLHKLTLACLLWSCVLSIV